MVAGAAGVLVATVVATERGRLAAEQAQAETLREVDRQRTALLRSVSHDLRTPLATIRAAATDLDTDVPYDAATRSELLGMVVEETERLDRIVANLLSLSRIEAGALLPDRQAVDIGELIDACTHRLHRLLARQGLEVAVDDDLPLVRADYSQLDQVLTNVLENAARHSPPTARSVSRRPGSGAGDGGHRDRSTTAPGSTLAGGRRSSSRSPPRRATSSRGVGLAICRAVVEAHGGTIVAGGSPPGGGVHDRPARRPPRAHSHA